MRRFPGVPVFFFFLILLALGEGCRPLEEIDPSPGQALVFSDDTVLFDTVFTTQRLASRRLRVYNRNDKPIEIEEVSFRNANSPFTVYVNGMAAPARGVRIEGKDSAFVLVQGKLPEVGMDTAFLLTDVLEVKVKGRAAVETVTVLAYGQDAIYYNDSVLPVRSVVWDNAKPYVIFNSILVPTGGTLTIKAGTRVHSYKNSSIFVRGTLIVEGTYEHRVFFGGTRLESEYSMVPEQWGAIVLLDSSQASIDWAIIQNGLRGVQVRVPSERTESGASLLISNTLIRNMSDVGIYGFNAAILGYNNVIADCGTSGIAGIMGGNYTFWQNTVAYSGNTPFSRRTPAVVFADNYKDASTNIVYLGNLKVNLANNVFTGQQDEEFLVSDRVGPNPLDTADIRHNVLTSRGRKWAANGNRSITGQLHFHRPLSYDFHPDSLMDDNAAKRAGLPISDIPEVGTLLNALRKDFAYQERPDLRDSVTAGAVQAFPKR